MQTSILFNLGINLTSLSKLSCVIGLFFSGIATDPSAKIVSQTKAKPAVSEPQWELEKDEDGVQIYVKPASANSYRQVKAVTRISTTLSAMVALIRDDASARKWMDRVEKFETIKEITPVQWYTYSEISIPWPFKNADIITKNTLTQDENGAVTIQIQNAPDYMPKQDGKSRVLRAGGGWIITPDKNGVVVEYMFHAKREGLSLPGWLVNAITVQSFHRSIERMKAVAQTGKYKDVKLSYLKQP